MTNSETTMTTFSSFRRAIIRAAATAALAALLGSATPARGELVNTSRGIPVQGEIVDVEEDGLSLRRVDGGLVRLRWDQIAEVDRTRLRRAHGLEADEDEGRLEIDGVRVTTTDGNVLEGVLAKQSKSEIELKQRGRNVLSIPRSRIATVEAVRISAFAAYTPAELYERKKAESEPKTPEDHYELAQYCQRIGAYDEAKTHLGLAVAADPEYRAAGIRAQMETLDRLVADRRLIELAETIREQFRSGLHAKVLEGLLDLETRAPGSPLLANLAKSGITKERVEARRRSELSRQIVTRWYQLARDFCTRKGREEGITLQAAKAYVSKEMGEEIVKRIAEALSIDAGEVRPLMAERKGGVKHVATYGSGTYLVEQKKKEGARPPPNRGRQSPQSSRNRREPQKPTAEDWWKAADLPARRDFLLATYVETTGDFELVRAEYDNCPKCGGRGFLVILVPGAENNRYACDRCWQQKTDKRVVFR